MASVVSEENVCVMPGGSAPLTVRIRSALAGINPNSPLGPLQVLSDACQVTIDRILLPMFELLFGYSRMLPLVAAAQVARESRNEEERSGRMGSRLGRSQSSRKKRERSARRLKTQRGEQRRAVWG